MTEQITDDEIRQWVITNYKHNRLFGMNDEMKRDYPGVNYGESVIASHIAHFHQYDYDCISRHESRTGDALWLGIPPWRKEKRWQDENREYYLELVARGEA